jgi:hypothetical protein
MTDPIAFSEQFIEVRFDVPIGTTEDLFEIGLQRSIADEISEVFRRVQSPRIISNAIHFFNDS